MLNLLISIILFPVCLSLAQDDNKSGVHSQRQIIGVQKGRKKVRNVVTPTGVDTMVPVRKGCSVRNGKVVWDAPGVCKRKVKKLGETCGTSSGVLGEIIDHGICEEGLMCDEPKQDPSMPGKCKKSKTGKKLGEECGTAASSFDLYPNFYGYCEEGLICESSKDYRDPGRCKEKPSECSSINNCVQKGYCSAYGTCACTNDYCTVPYWVHPTQLNKNCRSDRDCKASVYMCQQAECYCWNVDKNGKGTCLQGPR
eukprot:TRINITY_DN2939_c0_g1_i4.p1 TRINITY_DN2939_c0_g1~~TRINITY_DN2939_c0_g1_i4.p1  ORF type:complete len:254 (+),score=25.21 TRINITY_DN2939_c0_g1_i4:127-888(+)